MSWDVCSVECGSRPCVQLIDIIETVYRGASKGRGLVVSPKGPLLYIMLGVTDPLTLGLAQTIQPGIATDRSASRAFSLKAPAFRRCISVLYDECQCLALNEFRPELMQKQIVLRRDENALLDPLLPLQE